MRVIFVPHGHDHYGAWVRHDDWHMVESTDERWYFRDFSPTLYAGVPRMMLGYPLQPASENLWNHLLLLVIVDQAEVWEKAS